MHRPERRGDVEGAIGEDDGLVGRRFGDAAETLRRVSAMRETVGASARFEVRARAEVPTDRVQCRIVAADAARLVGAAARAIDTGPQAYTCRCQLRHRLGVGAPTREFSAHLAITRSQLNGSAAATLRTQTSETTAKPTTTHRRARAPTASLIRRAHETR